MALIMTRFAAEMRYLSLFYVLLLFSCSKTGDSAKDLFEEGKYDEAIAVYDDRLESGNDLDVLYNRARAFEEKGDLATAEKEYVKILEVDPEYLPAKLSLSKIAYEQEDYARSIMLSGDALTINPNSAKAHYLQARAKHQLGYTTSAMEGYDMAISLDENLGDAYLYRGALRQSLKRKGACEDFKVAKILKVPGAKEALDRFCD